MESTVFVGLDAHKSSIVAAVVDREGNKLDQTKLGSGDAELREDLGGLPGPAEVVLEACNVWPRAYDAAVSTGAKVTLAHPYKVRVISEASLKSDKVDSLALAQLLRLKAVPVAFAPDGPIRDLRQIVRDRAFYSPLS
jgi:transposase